MEAIAIRGVARGLIDRVYVEDHKSLLLTKYISCGPHGLRKDLSFPHYKSIGAIDPWGMTYSGLNGQSYEKRPLDIASY